MPEISILMATYNYGPFLQRALDSVYRQNVDPARYEIVVVDDGSTDDTPAILDRNREKLTVVSQANQGLPAACNAGIQVCRAPWIVRLDSDDELAPGALETYLNEIGSHPQATLFYADRTDVESTTNERTYQSMAAFNIYQLIAVGVIFRTEILKAIGGYEKLYWEEHDLLIRYLSFVNHEGSVHIPKSCYLYYRHSGSMTAKKEHRMVGWNALLAKHGLDTLTKYGSEPEIEEAAGLKTPLVHTFI